jgi:multidrug efflux system membrane fusion protein
MNRLLVGFILFVCAGGGGWYAFDRARAANASAVPEKAQPPSVPVSAATASRKDVPIYLDALGTVQAYSTVTVRPQLDGELVKIGFKEGQDVKKGDLLARISPVALQAQLDQATAKKKQDEAKTLQDHARVKQDQAKVKQDQAKKNQDEANLANSTVTLKRLEDAVVAHAVTQQSVDDARTLVATLTGATQGDDAAILGDEAALQADEAAIQADEATVLADDALIKYSQTLLGYTDITSPLDGRVGIRLVDEGNIVHVNDANGIVVVTQLQPISVIFTLPQQDLLPINERMAVARLPVLAMDTAGTTTLDRGELDLVDNQIDTSTGTIRLKATFPNAARKLWPGGFVNVRLLLVTHADSVVIPAPSVQQGPDGYFVFVIKSDETVEARPVKVSLFQDGEAVIESGLSAGDNVVLTGQDRLKQGSHVAVHQPGAKKDKAEKEDTGEQKKSESNDAKHPAHAAPNAEAGSGAGK